MPVCVAFIGLLHLQLAFLCVFSSLCQDKCPDPQKLICISTDSTVKILHPKDVTFDTKLMLVAALRWHCAVCLIGVLSRAWLIALVPATKEMPNPGECYLSQASLEYFLSLCQYFSV